MAAWTRWTEPWWLLGAAAVLGVAVVRPPRNRPLLAGGVLLLILGILAGFGGQIQLWGAGETATPSGLVDTEESSEALSRQFESLLESGDQAVEEALGRLEEGTDDLQGALARIRRRRGVSALAVYDEEGRPAAWVGMHRGQVPQSIRRGRLRYAFGGGPLFRYLYFTVPRPGDEGTVMAAVLLQANLPAGLEGGGFAARFRRATGIPIRILPPDRISNRAVWDLRWDGEALLSVAVEEGEPGARREGITEFWVRILTLLALGGWAFLTLGTRGTGGYRLGAGGTLLGIALLVPAGHLWPGVALTSAAEFLLPLPLDWTLGQVLGILLAVGVLCGLLPRESRRRPGPLLGAGAVAILLPLLDLAFRQGPSPGALAGGTHGWMAYQGALALAFALVVCSGFGFGAESPPEEKKDARWLLGGALALVLLLSLGFALLARWGPGFSPWVLAFWGVPTYLAARGLAGWGGRRRVLTWVLAALMGAAAALPTAWGTQIRGRMDAAEARLQELGAEADPFLEYRLVRMAGGADSLNAIIASPVELLFEVWSQSEEGGDPFPMWLTLWSPGGLPREDLFMGVQGPRPSVADDFLEVVREEGRPLVRHLGFADARYLLLVPLEGGQVLSAVVPPRGSPALSAPVGPIFAALGRRGVGTEDLTLVPVSGREEGRGGVGVRWERMEEGWRGHLPVSYLEGTFLARASVSLPGTLHMVARGTLTLLLDVVLVLLVWGVGRGMARGGELRLKESFVVLRSFRARVTLALFGFFLLSIAIFGTLAFQTLSTAAEKTASALAERIVEDGASFYLDVQGSMPLLAQEVGAELLEYRNGELREGSGAEGVELGLYEGWVPEPVFRALDERREVRATIRSSLGRWDYIMAYRRLPDGDILATPVPVEAGATALRRQEMGDLLGFAIVLGAGLSLALALLVARTLTRPIATLQVASERVGSGNLEVQLPAERRDEFGSVFDAFNRMVLRIRRARRALVRTTRRTQAIVEEAATGVVALDGSGRVTLVNPRAETLLGQEVEVGAPLPEGKGEALELVRWVDLYFRDGLREANTELQMGDRRIRIRARRISGESPLGGAVLSLEDVTDELRTERILAWGEMARQVAHEVKNPLTPIKLSVQHLQRAWVDGRGDFGEILDRNVQVILKEIEHLATIARSFSRFAVPRAPGEEPLEEVSVEGVVGEVMDLYRGGKGALEFQGLIPPELPSVRARESELREVLINLLENSRAAIPEEGTVVIEGEETTGGVELRVKDDGTGISPELLPRIFEPHFSTRSTGTGLGLAIVRRLVESWGGSVTAESESGTGTTIRLHLPRWGDEEVLPLDRETTTWS